MNKISLFTIFVLFWLGLGWMAVILAMTGFFYAPIILLFVLGGIIFLVRWAIKNKDLFKINKELLAVSAIAIVFIVIFSYFTTPTIFSGRDQGALSEAAIRLAQNHQLEFSTPASQEFFKIYGPGKALNFPGFSYNNEGQLISQFSAGYISWLAMFYSFFGLKGFIIANAVSFFIFVLSFYFLAKEILPRRSAYVALGLVLTSFVFSWFFKFTLSENLALALLWFGIWQFVLFLENNEKLNFSLFILSFGLLLFVRIETWAFLAVAIIILLANYKKQTLKIIGKWPVIIFVAIIAIYVLGMLHSVTSLSEPVKGFIKPFLAQSPSLSPPLLKGGDEVGVDSNETGRALKILWNYGLLDYIFLGILGFLLILKSKKLSLAIPFLIVLPSFIYLIEPNVSADQPWMLRRFAFSIIPASILYTIYFIESTLDKGRFLRYLTITAFLFINLLVFIPYLKFSPHKNLLAQTENISQNFTEKDLVLVDRLATGDGWSMMTGPMNFLFGKQTAYFFNLNDLAKIDTGKFSNVYFIIPNANLDFYKPLALSLVPVKDYQIENDVLISNNNNLPVPQKLETIGKIYLLKK